MIASAPLQPSLRFYLILENPISRVSSSGAI